MNVFEPSTLLVESVDPANFTGGGTLVRMQGVCQAPHVNAYRVTFDAGARTAWHTHSGPQLLIVLEGHCRFQHAGDQIRDVAAGGIISIEAGKPHWHGATPFASTTHVALNIEVLTTWLEKVTEEEYEGQLSAE